MSNIIFDFDGTIADSMPLSLELFYKFTGHKQLSQEEIENMRNMTHRELFKYLNVSFILVPKYLVKGRREFGKNLGRVKVFNGIPEALEALKMARHKLYVISSNSQQNIKRFLDNNKIDGYFTSVHGNIGLFGKATAIRFIVKKDKLDIRDCFSVGDEIRDIDAAKKAKVSSIAVTWGFNGEHILKKHHPDKLIHAPGELLKAVNG